jgi:hypothetical protein
MENAPEPVGFGLIEATSNAFGGMVSEGDCAKTMEMVSDPLTQAIKSCLARRNGTLHE